MQLGNFSVSLNVKDLEASRAFYAKLGFEPVAGNATQIGVSRDRALVARSGSGQTNAKYRVRLPTGMS